MSLWRKLFGRRKAGGSQQDVDRGTHSASDDNPTGNAIALREFAGVEVALAPAAKDERALESQAKHEEVRIDGALDRFQSPNIFQGWALNPGRAAIPLTVQVKRNETVIGSGTTSYCRSGLAKRYPENCAGFRVIANVAVNPAEIVSGEVKIVCLDESGREHALRTYDLLLARLAQANGDETAGPKLASR